MVLDGTTLVYGGLSVIAVGLVLVSFSLMKDVMIAPSSLFFELRVPACWFALRRRRQTRARMHVTLF
jgi:hypothetical protein